MRKGVGGASSGEAMRAKLSFQNSLRARPPLLGPPRNARSAPRPPRTPRWTARPASPTARPLSSAAPASPLRPRARPGWTPSPTPARDGGGTSGDASSPPKFPVPSPAVADAAATRSRASPAAAVVKSPQRTSTTTYGADGDDPSRAIRFGTPERPEGALARVDDRLPVFERLYRAVPSGQRPKFLLRTRRTRVRFERRRSGRTRRPRARERRVARLRRFARNSPRAKCPRRRATPTPRGQPSRRRWRAEA